MEPIRTRVVGQRKRGDSPEDYFRRAQALIDQMDRLNPYPRPRGFVKKFRTYADYEKWKAEQKNPRLW